MRRLILLFSLVLAGTALGQGSPEPASPNTDGKTEPGLRVLLVGHDPAAPNFVFRQLAEPRTYRLYRERTAAWEALLRYHFDEVQVVHGSDYKVEMSDSVDVTVFDDRPPVLAGDGADADSKLRLPRSFDRPAILIAENAPLIGEEIGLKLDWL